MSRAAGDNMRSRSSRVVLCLALATSLAVAASAPAATVNLTVGQTWVPYPRLLTQLRSGPLIRVIINPARMDVEIKFRDLDEWHAYYPAAAESELQRLVNARHVHVIYVPRPKAAAATQTASGGGHALRWALAGVAAALVLAGAAVLALRARRRRQEASG